MGTFVTDDDTPDLFDDKVALIDTLPIGATYENVPRAQDLNRIKAALFDLRDAARSMAVEGVEITDVRGYGTGVGEGDSDADTTALIAAAAASSASADGTNQKRLVVEFPPVQLLLEEALPKIYGSIAGVLTWRGVNGEGRQNSGRNGGSVIRWAGSDTMEPMIHTLGLVDSTFEGLTIDAESATGNRARYCWWAESAQREGGSISTNCKWLNNQFTGFGWMGAGFAAGDEVRGALMMTSVSGTFLPGELVLNTTYSAIAVVVSHVGSTLSVKEVLGNFSTVGSSIFGIGGPGVTASGATATTNGFTVDPNYQGNRQFSEAKWVNNAFNGTGNNGSSTKLAGWAGWQALGGFNNKNMYHGLSRFTGTRYGIDWVYGSGSMTVTWPIAGPCGHAGKGALFRFAGASVEVITPEFEGGDDTKCRFYEGGNAQVEFLGGDLTTPMPDDGFGFVHEFGLLRIVGTKLRTNLLPCNIAMGIGPCSLEGVAYFEDFTTNTNLYDTVGGNQVAVGDYGRVTERSLKSEGCFANYAGGSGAIRFLPDVNGRRVSPMPNQLLSDGVALGAKLNECFLSATHQTFRLTYSDVISASGNIPFSKTHAKGVIRGIRLDCTTTFRGGTISAMTLSIGHGSSATAYKTAEDVWTAVIDVLSMTAAKCPVTSDYVYAKFTVSGGLLAALTQGVVDVTVYYEAP